MATAEDVITRLRHVINDMYSSLVSGPQWSDAELLRYITDAQREIVKLKPEANAVTDFFPVVAGFPRQRLDPEVAYRLIRVEANGTGTSTVVNLVFEAGLQESEDDFTGYSESLLPMGTLISGTGAFGAYFLDSVVTDETGALFLVAFGESAPPPANAFESMTIIINGNVAATLYSADAFDTYEDLFFREWDFDVSSFPAFPFAEGDIVEVVIHSSLPL